MQLTLGFSPCPNDTFIFDALVNKKIDAGDLDFNVQLEDVQTLNQWAIEGKLDISKISYGVLPKILPHYVVLNSGGALGKGVGPLLIGPAPIGLHENDAAVAQKVNNAAVAIPGKDTTAHFLFSQAFPDAVNKVFLRFDEIETFVSDGNGLGVIIHENRFTYQQKGLQKIADLGYSWEKNTGYPIPLGGIVARRTIDTSVLKRVDLLISQSLAYAFEHYPHISDYVWEHAQEMDENVMRQHIDLYVNDFSMQLGVAGKAAIMHMLATLENAAIPADNIFVPA